MTMSTKHYPRTVLITGATGNLGSKVIEALARTEWCGRIVGLDRKVSGAHFSARALAKLELIQADLTQSETQWLHAFKAVDAVIHFAAANPLPDSSWEEALASVDMTENVLQASVLSGVSRFVFASSNHAMGAYKDEPLASRMGPGLLTANLAPAPGTRWFNGTHEVHSLAYGTSKILSEKICATVAQASGGRLSCVSVRVGWALTGDNDPAQISHAGAPTDATPSAHDVEAQRNLKWFRGMWLSNVDLENLFIAALTASSVDWPAPSVIVNGVSANTNSVWDIQSARAYLGFVAQDDVHLHIS
jgi:nucleoside-diphosphate-sugar epimerase